MKIERKYPQVSSALLGKDVPKVPSYWMWRIASNSDS